MKIVGRNVVSAGIEMVTDPDTGQLVEQQKLTISDDGAADTITILGRDDSTGDSVSMLDVTENGITLVTPEMLGQQAHHIR